MERSWCVSGEQARRHDPLADRGDVATQTFRNDTDHVAEATYIFPLPADAAVSAMSIVDGARTIDAAIERRAAALQGRGR